MTTVLGLDLSLASTGVATADSADTISVKGAGLNRMLLIVEQIRSMLSFTDPDLVVMEGPAYSKQAGQSGHHERAGLWWMVRYAVSLHGAPMAIVTPTGLKKYATGKGNADKDSVLISAVQRLPIVVANNNEADAAWLCAMGMDHLGEALAVMPQVNRAALDSVEWSA